MSEIKEIRKLRRALWKAATRLAQNSGGCPHRILNNKYEPKGTSTINWGCCSQIVTDLGTLKNYPKKYLDKKQCKNILIGRNMIRIKRCWFLYLMGAKNVKNVWKESKK